MSRLRSKRDVCLMQMVTSDAGACAAAMAIAIARTRAEALAVGERSPHARARRAHTRARAPRPARPSVADSGRRLAEDVGGGLGLGAVYA